MKRKLQFAALAALSVAALGSAAAARAAEDDAMAIATATVDLTQAISAAEQHVGGKASRAEYERHKGKWVFDVEVVKDKTIMDVKVDPANGKVLAATEDKTDHDDDHDQDD